MRKWIRVAATLASVIGLTSSAIAQPQVVIPGGPRPIVVGPVVGPVIGPVVGPVIGPVGPIIGPIRPPVRPPEAPPPGWRPGPSSRSLDKVPDPQAFITPGATGIYAEITGGRPLPRPRLKPYTPYQSPETPADPKIYNIDQVVVKLAEGSGLRIDPRRRGLSVSAPAQEQGLDRLARTGLKPTEVARQASSFNSVVARFQGAVGRASPQVDEAQLTALFARAEYNSGAEQADPNLFYYVHTQKASPEAAQELLEALRKLKIVEAAYFQPIPANSDIPPTTTIDVTPQQGYGRPAPGGIDVDFARRFAGGRGEGVRVVDVEAGWHVDHEDLPPIAFGYGVNFGGFDGEHGTAVFGEIVALENSYGATGLAPGVQIGFSSVTNIDLLMPWRTYFYSVGNALLSAGLFLRAGDIALIEQHFPTSAGPCPNTCNCAQFGYVAVESVPYEHAAISLLTAAGIIVVEAAGNGQMPVTPASARDSGAIVVGASDANLMPSCFTNFGPRVNVHAWGDFVGTLGYAEMGVFRRDAAGNFVIGADGQRIVDSVPDPSLRANGADARQFYTRNFGGTSGASPIVVSAAALVQSTRAARGLAKLNPIQMRTLLAATGTPQIPSTLGTFIGPQPNLAAAMASYIPDAGAFMRQTNAPTSVSTGAIFTQNVTFKNTGGVPWTGYTMAITQGDDGSYPWGTQSFTLGTPAAPVMPGDEVTGSFNLRTPAQAGSYTLSYVLRTAGGTPLAFSPRQTIAVAAPNTQFDAATVTIDVAPGSLRAGQATLVVATARNTGTTIWRTNYGMGISRSGRLQLPQPRAGVQGVVAPGQSQSFTFTVMCQAGTQGLSGFSVQMAGPSGRFGDSRGQNVVCQP